MATIQEFAPLIPCKDNRIIQRENRQKLLKTLGAFGNYAKINISIKKNQKSNNLHSKFVYEKASGFVNSQKSQLASQQGQEKDLSGRILEPTRRRSLFYYLARAELWQVSDLGKEKLDLGGVVMHFQHWLEHYHNQFIHLTSLERDLFLKSITRFSSEYKRSLKSRMRKMRDIKWAIKLEITLDPKKFLGLYDQFVFLPRLWNIVLVWLKRTYGKLEFLRIMEITKKGRPHLHILVAFHDPQWQKYFCSMRRRDKQRRFQAFYGEFKDVVLRNNGGWVWVRPIKGSLKLVNYVLKYVNKTISIYQNSKTSNQNLTYGALLFASNRRLFSVSRGLRVFADPTKKKQGYTFVGCVPASLLRSFCQEKDVPFGFAVSIDAELIDPYGYPLLFNNGEYC